MDIHVTIQNVHIRLPDVADKQDLIIQKIQQIMDKFQPLIDEVASLRSVNDSVIALLNGVQEQLADAKDDPEQIQSIIDSIAAEKTRLAAAVTSNTTTETTGHTGTDGSETGGTTTTTESGAPVENTTGNPSPNE